MHDPFEQDRQPEIVPASFGLTVQYSRRTMRMISVSDTELDAVASLASSINLAFFGISFGSLIAFAITLATVEITAAVTHASFVGLTWVSAVCALYFAVQAVRDYRRSKAKLAQIKSGCDYTA